MPRVSLCVAHLSCGNELKWSESDFQIGRVCFEIIQSTSNADLQLGRVLARRARGRDLVEGAHDCGVVEGGSGSTFAIRKSCVVVA
jgi:hypothetical protein